MIIKIPFRTPSVNHLYFNWNNRRILTKEARELKKEIKDICCKMNLNEKYNDKKLKVNVKIYENWFNKNGTIKKKDISNKEKFLIDSVFDGLGLDDKCIFKHQMIKIQSDKDYSIIKIDELKC